MPGAHGHSTGYHQLPVKYFSRDIESQETICIPAKIWPCQYVQFFFNSIIIFKKVNMCSGSTDYSTSVQISVFRHCPSSDERIKLCPMCLNEQ